MLRAILLTLALALALTLSAVPVAAGTWEDAQAAYGSGDYETAVRLWRPFAEQGNAAAQGIPQDYTELARWYRKAAEQGYAKAQTMLGTLYEGLGVPQDYADGQTSLGLMYGTGHAVPQDFVLAHMWFNLAAAQGSQEAISTRDTAAKLMTPAKIADAQKLAREWKPK
jgi:TPR repeat protein